MPEDSFENLRAQLRAAWEQIDALRAENSQLQAERDRLRAGPGQVSAAAEPPAASYRPHRPGELPYADRHSAAPRKIALFRALFAGRGDIYATRWVSTRTGRKGWSPAEVDQWSKRDDAEREFLPLTDAVIEAHLRGDTDARRDVHVGLYPMLPDDTWQLLAVDFDGKTWAEDTARADHATGRLTLPRGWAHT